jgi:DNA-directed RNA polymerase specialized sigma24 family protein
MAAQESSWRAQTAIKAAFDDLLREVIRHKDLLRSAHKWRRPGPPLLSAEHAGEVSFDESIEESKCSGEEIRRYLNLNLEKLERFVAREIASREAFGSLRRGSISREEVVDEVVLRALTDGTRRPVASEVETFFYHLTADAIAALNEEPAPLGEQAGAPEAPASLTAASEEPEFEFRIGPEPAARGTDGIRDQRAPTPEEIADSEEMVALVEQALRSAKPADREAFLLHVIDEFSPAEIAAITDRNPDQVQRSIAASREYLRRLPGMLERFRAVRGRPQTIHARSA